MIAPLSGLRVLDFTQFVSGPYCTLLLADLGAEVIKVEQPGIGDSYRNMGPSFINGESISFLSLNRNKKSFTLNLKAEEASDIVARLIPTGDILVENSRVGTMDRLGLGYDMVSAINSRMIYASISAYGQTGPNHARGGFDLILQGETGLMSMTGHPGTPPVKVPIAAFDFAAGMNATIGILAAVIARGETGRGQYVDTSLLESALGMLCMHVLDYTARGEVPKPSGSASHFFAPYQAFQTADSHIIIVGTGSTNAWPKLCQALSLPELVEKPQFATNSARLSNLETLVSILEERFVTQTTEYWLNNLARAGVIAGPVNTLADILQDSHVQAHGIITDIDHPSAGSLKMVDLPLNFSDVPPANHTPPPALGEHTGLTLQELGYSDSEIVSFQQAGVI